MGCRYRPYYGRLKCVQSISNLFVIQFVAGADVVAVDNTIKVTEEQLKLFLDICWTKYVKAKIEPGKFRLPSSYANC